MNNNDFNNNVYPFSNQNLGNGYTQPTQQTQINAGPIQQSSENSNNSYMNITPEKKDNKKILIIITLLIVGGLAFMGYKYFLSDVIESKKELYNTTSFFFENYQGEIALFSSEGEQLTDFMFTNYEGFVTNKAIVWKDKEVGIIDDKGQMIVPFGLYSYIEQAGIYYEANPINESMYHFVLLNNEGKVLYNYGEYDVIHIENAYGFYNSKYPHFLLEKTKEKEYAMINGFGEELFTFPMVSEQKEIFTNYNYEGNLISIFYDEKNWVFDAMSKNNITSFKTSEAYCIEDTSEKDDAAVLRACSKTGAYKVFKDKKIFDVPSECKEVTIFNNNVMCYTEEKDYVLTKEFEIGISIEDTIYLDGETYAKNNNKNGVDFYQNGNLVKTVNCQTIAEEGYAEYGFFLLEGNHYGECSHVSDNTGVYNQNGEKLFEDTYLDIKVVSENSLIAIQNGDFLIDNKGNILSNTYNNLMFSDGYVIATKNNLKGIVSLTGEEIVSCEYKEIDLKETSGKVYARLKRKDGKYSIYNLEEKKEVGIYEKNPSLYNNYYVIKADGKYVYLTYNGKIIYEREY